MAQRVPAGPAYCTIDSMPMVQPLVAVVGQFTLVLSMVLKPALRVPPELWSRTVLRY